MVLAQSYKIHLIHKILKEEKKEMKKKLALLLAAVMVAAMVPVSAFAKTDNNISKTVVVKKDDTIKANGPELKIDDRQYGDITTGEQFYISLEGAEFVLDDNGDWKEDGAVTGAQEVVTLSKTELSVVAALVEGKFNLPLNQVKVTGDEAKVIIDANHSGVTAGTYTFAYTTTANATAKIAGVVDVPVEGGAVTLKDITVTETIAAAIGDAEEETTIKLRLYGEFTFADPNGNNTKVTFAGSNGLEKIKDVAYGTKANGDDDKTELVITVPTAAVTDAAGKLVIKGIAVAPTKDCEAGDVAEIVISGAGVEKTALEVAKAVSYGMTFTPEDKKLPVFYAGRTSDKETLTVTIKETAPESWWLARKTTLTFPEGVEPVVVNVEGTPKNFKTAPLTTDFVVNAEIDENVVTIDGYDVADPEACLELKLSFELAIAPDFTGDITVVLGGPAVPEDMEVVVGEAQYPVTFEVEVSDVSIDYRNVAVGDIVIKEAFAGALAKGDVLTLAVDGHIELEDGVKFVVEEGDMKLKDTSADGVLKFTVDKESYKTPATVRITNVEAYLQRSLPAGSYALDLVLSDKATADIATKEYDEKTCVEAYFQNYSGTKNETGAFTTKSIELAPAYIEVVTAGRDQDDSSFTTQIKVTVGANEMVVGQGVVALDVPAYIANGYTMLPVRAVADALSGDAATVLWNGETKTVTIAFGARIISMTIGSKVMNINGVEIGMNAAPEIVNNRTFLPLRDLGYALGLTDADIVWDDATKTATLN